MSAAMKNLNKAVSKLVDEVQTAVVEKVEEFVKVHVKDQASFEAAFEEFKKTLKADILAQYVAVDAKKGANVERKKRTPSEYNTFIGAKIKELKEKNGDKDGKELMKMAIEAWKSRPQAK